jgi:hypothetical protein
MAALILVKRGLEWQASGGLFDWTLEYLIPRLSDKATAESLRTVVDNNLGSIWISDFPPATQDEIFHLFRSGLVAAAEQDLPDGPAKGAAIAHLQELVDLTHQDPA